MTFDERLQHKLQELMESKPKEWIGVDLDGTLAKFTTWKGLEHVGEPIEAMIKKVKNAIKNGKYVKIFTARVSPKQAGYKKTKKIIQDWSKEHIGRVLDITHEKDPFMVELWDDRARQVKRNQGTFVK